MRRIRLALQPMRWLALQLACYPSWTVTISERTLRALWGVHPIRDFCGSRPGPTSPANGPRFAPHAATPPPVGRARFVRGRVTPHRKSPAHRVVSLQKMTANKLPSKQKQTMHLLLTPFLASALYIGGGSVGLLLVIVIVVLLLR